MINKLRKQTFEADTAMHSMGDFDRGLNTKRYIKPTICTRDFLTKMSIDLRPERDWGFHLAKATGLDVSTITELNLEFSNIQSTYGLGYLRFCRKLLLNNNILSRIIGLDDLKQLKTLDLSFNNLEKIEGLHNCTKLEEVLLFHNNIQRVEGLETLTKLVLVNLGCNRVADLQDSVAFRHLPAIRSVILERNPVAKLKNYRETMVTWVPQLKSLDWKRVQPTFRSSANELLKEEYRAFLSKERAEEKRHKHKKFMIATVHTVEYSFIPEEYGNSLYHYLNSSEDQLAAFMENTADAAAALQAYRRQVVGAGHTILGKAHKTLEALNHVSHTYMGRIQKCLDSYAICGKKLVEGLILRRPLYRLQIAAEVESKSKDHLRSYCQLIDDLSFDLVKLLLQLQLKIQQKLQVDILKRLQQQLTHERFWFAKEFEVLRQFEGHFNQWIVDADSKLATQNIAAARVTLADSSQQQTTPDSKEESKRLELLDSRLQSNVEKLTILERKIQNAVSEQFEELNGKLMDFEEETYHSRMIEILDFVDQHKAEAYSTRKRMFSSLGRQDEDDLSDFITGTGGYRAAVGRHNAATMSMQTGKVRAQTVEFESNEPLPDYVVMNDIKDVVDHISKVPLEKRRQLFEMRVLEVDDIADHIDVQDEYDQERFRSDLQQRQESKNLSADQEAMLQQDA